MGAPICHAKEYPGAPEERGRNTMLATIPALKNNRGALERLRFGSRSLSSVVIRPAARTNLGNRYNTLDRAKSGFGISRKGPKMYGTLLASPVEVDVK
jgi:hypothetical protein